jgi:hypothetical protein
MSSGKDKPKEVKPSTTSSVVQGVRNTSTNLPGFGSATSIISGEGDNKSIANTFTPDAQVAGILEGAKQGVASNQSIFNLTPEQQFAQVDQNPYYQYAKTQNKNYLDQGQADARQYASQSGLENSTIAGAIEASLLRDAAEQDIASRMNAIDYSRAIAGENIATQQGLLDQIYGFSQGPLELSNSSLMQAVDSQDQVGMFNAGQIQNASMANAQMANQMAMAKAQRRSALIGNLISAGASLGSAWLMRRPSVPAPKPKIMGA